MIRTAVEMNDGSEVKHSGNRYLISFTSVSNALTCARDIRKHIKSMHQEMPRQIIQIKIGLSAGSPVSGKQELFGEAVQLAQRLCEVANQDQVVVSSMVNDLFASEGINQLKNEVNVQAFRPADEQFMNSLVDITESAWNEPGLDVEKYCREIGLSRSQLYRKTTSLTGLSPNDFIREYRLKKALGLIESKKGNISEIAFEAGFNSPSYFSKCFKRRFGVLPTDLAGTLT